MSDISIALQLAEHFRQENEGLKRDLNRALTEPRIMGAPIVSFAGWQVRRVSPDSIEATGPAGHAISVSISEPIFGLLARIADWQSS